MRDKHHITEERNEGKLSRSVLKTSGTGDSLAEFNATTSTNQAWHGSQLHHLLNLKLDTTCPKACRNGSDGVI